MKRVGYIYEKIYETTNIEKAIQNASKGKKKQRRVKKILNNKEKYVAEIQKMLKEKTFKTSPYKIMYLKDGASQKVRKISKPVFYPDQIIHWALIQQIEFIIMRGMYEYTCGSVPKRGSSKGQKAIRKWLDKDKRRTKYCLKMDVRKYYPSIDNKILKNMFRRKIKDKNCLWLIDTIIDSANGLPIGNYTSQWFANFYLERLDHYIKSLPGVKYYVRYIDDLVILGPNKKKLHKARKNIDEELRKIRLTMKNNWQIFKINSRPIDFLGFKFYRNYTTLRSHTALRIMRRAKKIKKKGRISYKDACAIISYWGWIKRSNSYYFYHKNVKPYADVNKARKVVSEHAKRNSARKISRF